MDPQEVEGRKQTKVTAIISTANNIRKSTKQLYKRVKTKLHPSRKVKDTIVEEIHITPESECDVWAERSMGRPVSRPTSGNDAIRCSSTDDVTRVSSATSSCSYRSASSKNPEDMEIVHDMELGYPKCESMFS